MARRPTTPTITHANLSTTEMQAGVTKLERRIAELKSIDLDNLDPDSPALKKIESRIVLTIGEIFGNNTHQFESFDVRALRSFGIMIMGGGESPYEMQRRRLKEYREGITDAITRLESAHDYLVEKLEDNGISTAVGGIKSFEAYDLHPTVAKVSGSLYKNGHYAEAIFAACKALNMVVQTESGRLDLDGTPLMQQVFSEKSPTLRFNTLDDKWEQDEQRGFMNLFQGCIAAFRNQRGHKFVEDDPEFALEVIAFVSFLCKLAGRANRD
jgi:uncharacterized protein (TIGR02391 family)